MKRRPLSQNFVVVESMETEKTNKKTLRNKIVIESPESITGRDEMNLIELPFCLVSYRNSSNIKTLKSKWIGQDEKGNKREFYNIITSTDEFGLPTFRGEEVIIATLGITSQQGFQNPQVHTTKREMLSLMRWPIQGHYFKLLTETLHQIEGVLIASNHFWDMEGKVYKEKSFHILEGHEFFDTSRRKKGANPKGYIRWNTDFWEFMQKGFIKPLNTEIYFSLPSNLQRRLYRYADKHLYNGGIEIDLYDLAFHKLAMVGYQRRAEVKRRVQDAVDGLNSRGLTKACIAESKTRSGYKVVLAGPKKSLQRAADAPDDISEQGSAEKPPEAQISPSEGPSDTDQGLTDQLIARGIGKTTAQNLVKERRPSVVRHLEVFDFLMAKGENGIEKPAGYLRKMIEEDWFLDKDPEGFISKAEQKQRQLDREVAEKKLLTAYQQDLDHELKDLELLMALPLKEQVARQLESWKKFVTGYQKGKPPSERMIAKREAELIKELESQSREQRVAFKRAEVIQQYQTLAQKQGIGDINFHTSEEVQP